MITIDKNSDYAVIVIHEIYGINKHMEYICQSLSEQGLDIICPNLLGRDIPFHYDEERVAYRHFMENIGFERAADEIRILLRQLKTTYKKVFILGFSVGATVAWLCSKEQGLNGIVGYYGSRIRDYLEISPQCPALLIFPQEERSFHVDELMSYLEKQKIEVTKYDGLHGFSDPYSLNYHASSAHKAFESMLEFIFKATNK